MTEKKGISKKLDDFIKENSRKIKLASWFVVPNIVLIIILKHLLFNTKNGIIFLFCFYLTTLFPVFINGFLKVNNSTITSSKKKKLFFYVIFFGYFLSMYIVSYLDVIANFISTYKPIYFFINILIQFGMALIVLIISWYMANMIISIINKSKILVQSKNFHKYMNIINKIILGLIGITSSIIAILLSLKSLLN